jgi:hypothetical protein
VKTDDLVRALAADVAPVKRVAPGPRLVAALVVGTLGAGVLLLAGLGLNPGLAATARQPMFVVKATFAVSLVLAAALATARLSRPGAALAWVPAAIAAPLLAIWALAAAALGRADPGDYSEMVLGQTWSACPFNIATLALPVFVTVLWAIRGLAPTRLRLAGAAAGLLAGATGASVYTLHCPELAAPFLAVWYVLGMLIPTAAGALLGPRLLRW